MLTLILWLILFLLCWPLAILALFLYPFIWLLLLPFRIVGIAVEGLLEALRVLMQLPFHILGSGRGKF
jgi:hypothetical protein